MTSPTQPNPRLTHPFRERLASGIPFLFDGAMGTELYARGIPYERCFDELNLRQPELVQAIHRDYIAAGAEGIETNTFSSTRIRLAPFGLEARVRDFNLAGVRLAREAREVSGEPVFLAGSVSTIGQPLAPAGTVTPAKARAIFAEQIEALLEGGVDLLLLETFSDPRELREAILAARSVSADLPIIAEVSVTEAAETLTSATPEEVVAALEGLAIDAIGVNCGVGPQAALDATERMARHTPLPLSVMPNAGYPAMVGGRQIYIATPAYFADYAQRFLRAGATILGGCCGTTPAHTAAMRAALGNGAEGSRDRGQGTGGREQGTGRQAPPQARVRPAGSASGEGQATEKRKTGSGPSPSFPTQVGRSSPSFLTQVVREGRGERGPAPQGSAITLKEKLGAEQFVVSVEVDPPRGLNPRKMLEGAVLLREAGADCVDIGDSPMARVRMSSIAFAALCQQRAGIESMIHFTSRDRNLMALQSDLLGAHALGIRSVIALTGDPPRMGSFPSATGVWDVDSVGLIAVIKRLNEGFDWAGNSIGRPTQFLVACALNPMADNLDLELERYWKKVEAGADLAITQPLYNLEQLDRFLSRVPEPPIPTLVEVMPLQSFKHAEFCHNELAGVVIPEEHLTAMRTAGDQGIAAGYELALRFLRELHGRVQGILFVPSFHRYELVAGLVRETVRLISTAKTSLP
jgi:methionine synthase I (cobalamin-dependent)/5,10-methylenetetrahydrofolate reductase